MAEIVSQENKLTPEQVQGITALLTKRDIKSAAKEVGVSETTMYRWMADPDFNAALKAAECRMIEEATRRLVQTSNSALDVLILVMADKKVAPGVRVRAAGLIIENMIKVRQMIDFEQRLARLEEASREQS